MKVHGAAWRLVAEGLLRSDERARDDLAQLISLGGIAWPEVVYLADSQYVTPGLWKALDEKGLAPLLPEDAAQYLRAVYEMNLNRNAALKKQLAEIVDALAVSGVETGLIKGAAHLHADMHGDLGARMMTDLDLMVRESDVPVAQGVLATLGYGAIPDERPDPAMHHHLPPVFRQGEFAGVELHTEPTNLEARRLLDAEEYWRDSLTASQNGPRTPSPTHGALLAIVHSEVADRNLRKLIPSLRCLQDVSAKIGLHGSAIDWDDIAERFRKEGQGSVFEDFLYILRTLTGQAPLPEATQRLRSRIRLYGCRQALRLPFIKEGLVRFHDLSDYRLRQRFGDNKGLVARFVQRLRVVTNFFLKFFNLGATSDNPLGRSRKAAPEHRDTKK